MGELTSGIALCTFNGKKYIRDQLESILRQVVLPSQIVICDDASTDGTWEYLNEWAKNCPVPTTIHRNKQRLGVAKNFVNAISAVDKDIIFFCDQDDIWERNKTALILDVFQKKGDVLLVHTDAELVNEFGATLGTGLLQALEISTAEKKLICDGQAFDVLIRRNVITGATVAIRRQILRPAFPIPDGFLHDEWFGLVASLCGRIVLLEKSTIKYRQHQANVIGLKSRSLTDVSKEMWWEIHKNDSRKEIRRIFCSREQLSKHIAGLPNIEAEKLKKIESALAFSYFRSNLPLNPFLRLFYVSKNMVFQKYARYLETPWLHVLRDLINR